MTPHDIRSAARPLLYGNPFWTDPVDPPADPVIAAAAADLIEWDPVRRERNRICMWVYGGLWGVELLLILRFFAQTSDEDGERWGWAIGINLIIILIVAPAVMVVWCHAPNKKVQQATASIRAGSAQRYAAWLDRLRVTDPVAHGQVVLWHQGNQAHQMAKAQLVTQLYTAYQVTQTRNDIRRNR